MASSNINNIKIILSTLEQMPFLNCQLNSVVSVINLVENNLHDYDYCVR